MPNDNGVKSRQPNDESVGATKSMDTMIEQASQSGPATAALLRLLFRNKAPGNLLERVKNRDF